MPFPTLKIPGALFMKFTLSLSVLKLTHSLLPLFPPSDVVVVITFEVELENAIGSLIVCLPYSTLEPIRSKLHASFQSERLEIDHVWVSRFKERLLETPVELLVRLGKTKITGRQLLNLEQGDLLLLNTDEEDTLECEVGGVS